ncbi:hypothetical protein GW777_06900 [Candidatus Peregrinibacteria bacterium]|nr:hypothetical protein [Candidatus Peregrinibacteria bacterium]
MIDWRNGFKPFKIIFEENARNGQITWRKRLSSKPFRLLFRQERQAIASGKGKMEQGTVNMLIPIIGAVIVFVSGLVTWYLNERSKRIYEEYKRKEDKYSALIRSLRGFYVDSFNKELQTEFLNQLNLCWMYCPDEVIHKAYNFLLMVHTAQKYSDEEKEKAVGELILTIRKDLISKKPLVKTNLKPEDFRYLRAT